MVTVFKFSYLMQLHDRCADKSSRLAEQLFHINSEISEYYTKQHEMWLTNFGSRG